MKPVFQYATLNAAGGAFVGALAWLMAIGNGYFIFPIGAALAAFVTGIVAWMVCCGFSRTATNTRVALAGLITGTVSHYVCWVLLSIGMNICYALTGGCTDSLGNPPDTVEAMLTAGFLFSIASIAVLGWLSVLFSVGIGSFVNARMQTRALSDNHTLSVQ